MTTLSATPCELLFLIRISQKHAFTLFFKAGVDPGIFRGGHLRRKRHHLGAHTQWRNRGAECPPETSDREIFADLSRKKRQGKTGKRGENGEKSEEKKENCKREGGKLKKEGGKVTKWLQNKRTFFFFFWLFTFENDNNLFWVYQNGNFLLEKIFHAGKKIRKNDFAPSEKYACYAPAHTVRCLVSAKLGGHTPVFAKIRGGAPLKIRPCFQGGMIWLASHQMEWKQLVKMAQSFHKVVNCRIIIAILESVWKKSNGFK